MCEYFLSFKSYSFPSSSILPLLCKENLERKETEEYYMSSPLLCSFTWLFTFLSWHLSSFSTLFSLWHAQGFYRDCFLTSRSKINLLGHSTWEFWPHYICMNSFHSWFDFVVSVSIIFAEHWIIFHFLIVSGKADCLRMLQILHHNKTKNGTSYSTSSFFFAISCLY